jgi:hypothetical protein
VRGTKEEDWREWMGVEPTMASLSLPINGFEDRGGHRVSTTPTHLYHTGFLLWGQDPWVA